MILKIAMAHHDVLYRKMQAYHGQDILDDDFSMMAIHFA